MLREELKHIPTRYLVDSKQISADAANYCISIGLNTLSQIIDCFKNGGLFYFRKGGRKVCKELENLCNDIIPQIIDNKEVTIKSGTNIIACESDKKTTSYQLSENRFISQVEYEQINLQIEDEIIISHITDFKSNRVNLEHITTEHLRETYQLSVRAAGCCTSLGLNTLEKILLFFENTGSFSKIKIKNAGRNTRKELDEFCISVISNTIAEKENISNEELKYITIENLLNTNQISLRAANCLRNTVLGTLDKIVGFYKDNGSFHNKKLRSAGYGICEELDELCQKIIRKTESNKQRFKIKEVSELINELSEKEREILLSLSKLIIAEEIIIRKKNKVFSQYCHDDFSFAIDFYHKNGNFPMFWILEQYLINDNAKYLKIFTATTPIFQDKEPCTFEEIACELSLSPVHTRKIRNIVYNQVFENTQDRVISQKKSPFFKYCQLLEGKDEWVYTINLLQEAYNINQKLVEFIEYLKKQEQCNLSVEFALQIIANVFSDEYILFGGFDFSNRKKVWHSTYLIKKEFADIFDFEKFRDSFEKLITNNEIVFFLNIEEYVANSQCWLKNDYEKSDDIIRIIRDILLYEFHLFSEDIDDKIRIPAMKKLNPSMVVYEILKAKGEPMSLVEIFDEFKEISPEHKYTLENNPNRLRPFIYNNDAISFRKRGSIYTLKEWAHIKSGSIRDSIIDFLANNNLPQSLENISNNILQYFPETNIASVKATMFNDSKKRFTLFRNTLFGLANEEYPPEYEQIELSENKPKSFEQRLCDFEKYIIENRHFPFSRSEDKNEVSLYKWWYRIVNGINTISESQQSEVTRVQKKYAEYETDKNMYEWNLNYNKLKIYLIENRRVPSAIGAEKFLYGWFHRTKDDFNNYRLNEEQRKKFTELAKMV
ncbi:MAG: hypothetical protein LBU83_02555 [Bacteroidales bacterium]|jgi:hypothetical protein|nr:hypothetical protein [Bacteroidales bacterium]